MMLELTPPRLDHAVRLRDIDLRKHPFANSNYLQDFGVTPEIISAGQKSQMGNREQSPLLNVRMFEIECRCMAATSLASWAVFPRI